MKGLVLLKKYKEFEIGTHATFRDSVAKELISKKIARYQRGDELKAEKDLIKGGQ